MVEVRVSIHVGAPQVDPRDDNNFVGKTVDYTARLNDFAQGGQILDLAKRRVDARRRRRLTGSRSIGTAHRSLRGIGNVEVHELVYRDAGPMETIYRRRNSTNVSSR